MSWHLQPDGVAIVLVHLDDKPFRQKVASVSNHLRRKGEGFEALLVHKVETISIAVEEGCGDHIQVRILELITGLERLIKDRTREEITHLQAHQSLGAPDC